MKKFFTLAAALLTSFSLWAAVTVPAGTLDPTNVPTEGWAGKWAPAAVTNGDWVCFSPYEIYQSQQAWAAKDASGSTDGTWGATDPFPASSAWTTNDGKSATVRQGQKGPYYYRITNTTEVAALVKSGSNKKRTVFLEAYELNEGVAPETATKSTSMESSTMAAISLTDLSASKEYLIVVRAEDSGSGGSSSGNSTYYAIGFKSVSKTVVSTEESLTAVTINDVAISATDLASLVSSKTLSLEDAYVTAPVVKFTKRTVITYDDSSTNEKDEVIEVTATADGNLWKASATIAGEEYTIAANKAASYTVTYMFGKNVLGTEMVAVGAEPTEYAQYQTMTLATFEGWYRDEELTTPVSLPMAINQDYTFYANFTKAYISKSLNIEQLVLDYGTKYDIKSALTDAGWAYASLNDLDTLNDIEKKDNRNYAFLGLKLKTQGAYVQGWLKTDGVLLVKFGNLGSNINVVLKGSYTDVNATLTKDDLWSEDDQAYVLAIFGHSEDVLVTISTAGSSTVVLKQLMVDEIAEVTLPTPGAFLVTVAESENGKVEATWPNKKYRTPVGETVTLNITGVEGYGVDQIKVNDEPIEAVEGVYSFIMPATDVTVTATFKAWPTAIDNTEVAGKAVKVVRNGQVVILRDGKSFNVLGTELK